MNGHFYLTLSHATQSADLSPPLDQKLGAPRPVPASPHLAKVKVDGLCLPH